MRLHIPQIFQKKYFCVFVVFNTELKDELKFFLKSQQKNPSSVPTCTSVPSSHSSLRKLFHPGYFRRTDPSLIPWSHDPVSQRHDSADTVTSLTHINISFVTQAAAHIFFGSGWSGGVVGGGSTHSTHDAIVACSPRRSRYFCSGGKKKTGTH